MAASLGRLQTVRRARLPGQQMIQRGPDVRAQQPDLALEVSIAMLEQALREVKGRALQRGKSAPRVSHLLGRGLGHREVPGEQMVGAREAASARAAPTDPCATSPDYSRGQGVSGEELPEGFAGMTAGQVDHTPWTARAPSRRS